MARPLTRSAILAALVALSTSLTAQILSPESHFGFRMGADRQLTSADAIEHYFEQTAAASDRVELTDIGRTTEGHRTIAAIVSAPENIARLTQIRAANQRLSDPRTLPPDEARGLAASHKAVVAIGASIHASEIGATQAANELLHTLATSTDPAVLTVLQNIVIILIPSLNPDGHRIVVDWYERNKGTKFEGGPMPWLYHKYVGHDINRDAFMMNMPENRNLARFFYTEWHPQVFLTMHQMGVNGPRFFVPPNDDPIDANYDPLIWRTAGLLGSAMALELQREGKSGVISNAMYDYYWPGYEDSAPLGHNTVCLLTEVASVRIATPVTVSANDLRGGQRALPDYRPRINFPDPWPGGNWTLRNIVDYDLTAVRGLLTAVSAYREQIVQNFYEMGRRAVEAGRRGAPFAFLVRMEQHDPLAAAKLEDLLIQGGVEVHRTLEPFRADGEPYPAGTDIILMSQPFRAYVKTLLERQSYPARRPAPGAPTDRPYDVAGWTLPQQMGVEVVTIERYFETPTMSRLQAATIAPANVWGDRRPDFYVIDGRGNGAAIAVNRLVAAAASPSWIGGPLVAGGFRYPPGSIVVPFVRGLEPVVAKVASELGLRVDGVRGKPPAATSIGKARVALYKPWGENPDEGWTRWLLEKHEFTYTTVADAEIRAGNLRARYDAIVLPSASSERLTAGLPLDAAPPEYAGGLGATGIDALKRFVTDGGTLICLDQSCALAIETFNLPIRDAAREAGDKFFCPGSILRLDLDASQPLAYGMTPQTAAFFAFSAAYEPAPGDSVQTIARYGTKDLLLSGWLEGEQVIAGKSAVVQATVGAGRVVLLGFRVQHRGQSHATFRLLFNSIFAAPIQLADRRAP
jgi:zinc carboxypeptidase